MRFFTLFVPIALALLIACSNNTSTPTPTAVPILQPSVTPTSASAGYPWLTHKSEAGDIAIQYPATATFYDNERPSPDDVVASAPDTIAIQDQAYGCTLVLTCFGLQGNGSLAGFVDSHTECADVTAAAGQQTT